MIGLSHRRAETEEGHSRRRQRPPVEVRSSTLDDENRDLDEPCELEGGFEWEVTSAVVPD